MNKILIFIIAILITGCSFTHKNSNEVVISKTEYVNDNFRNRTFPIEEYSTKQSNNKIVLINAGYGCSATEYSYIAKNLAKKGYLVVSIQHELQTDEFLPSAENMYEARLPNWKEGIKNIEATIDFLKKKYPNYDFEKLNLIGHSNGGDITMLFATQYPEKLNSAISLDNRRMPIPRTDKFKILSIRADEFQADPGVIPEDSILVKDGIKIFTLKNIGHNYLRDNATKKTKELILSQIDQIL